MTSFLRLIELEKQLKRRIKMQESKSIFKSKTLWLAAGQIIAEVGLLVSQVFEDNPTMTIALWGKILSDIMFIIMRAVSTQPVHVIESKEQK